MERKENERRSIPVWMVLILMADIGIFICAWQLHEIRKCDYDTSGLSLAQAPAQDAVPVVQAAPRRKPDIKDSLAPRVRSAPPPRRKARRTAKKRTRKDEGGLKILPDGTYIYGKTRAEKFYFRLLQNERFRRSKVFRAWKREFLSDPQLRSLNARYHEDKNAYKFLIGVSRSSGFQKLLGKYLHSADVQTFIRAMSRSPEVMSSAGGHINNGLLRKTVGRMGETGKLYRQSEANPDDRRMSRRPGAGRDAYRGARAVFISSREGI